MPKICLYFHVHQPCRLRKFNILHSKPSLNPAVMEQEYFEPSLDSYYFRRASEKCYLPANAAMLKLIEETGERFKVNYSITGTFLEQAGKHDKRILESFQQLASTSAVEFVGETHYHSLSSLFPDLSEFEMQVRAHENALRDYFGFIPKSFRNTELLYDNRIAKKAEELGYETILAEGAERVLGWRSPNYLYKPKHCSRIKVLLRNYRLSDDVGYRFSERSWKEWPLTSEKYANWLSGCEGNCVNLFMDYETFGEHHWPGSGIFSFLEHFPHEALKHDNLSFANVSELSSIPSVGEVDVPFAVSWADLERDASAWLGNRIQQACFRELQELGKEVMESKNENVMRAWRKLQTSDHLYYLCTKNWSDGDVHKHFSPHKEQGPYDNFISFMNILQDFKSHLLSFNEEQRKKGEVRKEKIRLRVQLRKLETASKV